MNSWIKFGVLFFCMSAPVSVVPMDGQGCEGVAAEEPWTCWQWLCFGFREKHLDTMPELRQVCGFRGMNETAEEDSISCCYDNETTAGLCNYACSCGDDGGNHTGCGRVICGVVCASCCLCCEVATDPRWICCCGLPMVSIDVLPPHEENAACDRCSVTSARVVCCPCVASVMAARWTVGLCCCCCVYSPAVKRRIKRVR